ncbi:MAG: alpha/beta hydrolase [Bacteriovoracaceae bacterium]|nr:alpha/beta hydrolase [Bacteriovoracaceae bacterium]
MAIKIVKTAIPFQDEQSIISTNAFCFLPDEASKVAPALSIFTHGFTSHKGSILNWSLRLAEEGIPSLLFDLPGHYLGGFTEVTSFDAFKRNAAQMFESATQILKDHLLAELGHSIIDKETKVIIGGHSLGALLSLKACDALAFSNFQSTQVIAVGFGLPPEGVTHIFNTPFYKSTLAIRAQLVSEAISPEVIFPWIKKEKESLNLTDKNIYLLTGADDVVVGKDGTERLRDQLQALGNNVVLEKPAKLAHHLPENAAPHIKKWLKDQGFFQN